MASMPMLRSRSGGSYPKAKERRLTSILLRSVVIRDDSSDLGDAVAPDLPDVLFDQCADGSWDLTMEPRQEQWRELEEASKGREIARSGGRRAARRNSPCGSLALHNERPGTRASRPILQKAREWIQSATENSPPPADCDTWEEWAPMLVGGRWGRLYDNTASLAQLDLHARLAALLDVHLLARLGGSRPAWVDAQRPASWRDAFDPESPGGVGHREGVVGRMRRYTPASSRGCHIRSGRVGFPSGGESDVSAAPAPSASRG